MERGAVTGDVEMANVSVADHAPSPGGRFVSDGPFSGEWFRDEILAPALAAAIERDELLTVELDGTLGYGSSFLEEAFGGLVRERGFRLTDLAAHLAVVAKRPLYKPYQALAERYIREARAYDHNHGKPCEVCCEHAKGRWQLHEHYGANNGKWACRAGCGDIRGSQHG